MEERWYLWMSVKEERWYLEQKMLIYSDEQLVSGN